MNDEFLASVDAASGLAALAKQLDGGLYLPSDDGWDAARTAWQLEVDQRPAAVVEAAGAADVVATVAAAGVLGLRVAAQATGHNAAPLGDLGGTILLSTRRMRGVSVDAAMMIARVDAGAIWGDLTPMAGANGLAALAGSSHDVGIVGYTLGGGLSWLARSHGLASSSVTAIDVVTADGVLWRVDQTEHLDLFWALRGGGSDFGIVTALEFGLYPIAEVHAGALFFPLERAAEVLHAWRDWTEGLPASVTTVGRVLRFPPMPDLRPFLSGQSFAVVEAVIQEDEATADALLAPLRALGPAMDTFHRTPVQELDQLHMDPPGPVPSSGNGALVGSLTAGQSTRFSRRLGRRVQRCFRPNCVFSEVSWVSNAPRVVRSKDLRPTLPTTLSVSRRPRRQRRPSRKHLTACSRCSSRTSRPPCTRTSRNAHRARRRYSARRGRGWSR